MLCPSYKICSEQPTGPLCTCTGNKVGTFCQYGKLKDNSKNCLYPLKKVKIKLNFVWLQLSIEFHWNLIHMNKSQPFGSISI
jgi:hypothetical protein